MLVFFGRVLLAFGQVGLVLVVFVVVVRFVDGLVGEALFLGLVFVFVLLRVVYRCLV